MAQRNRDYVNVAIIMIMNAIVSALVMSDVACWKTAPMYVKVSMGVVAVAATATTVCAASGWPDSIFGPDAKE